MPKTFINTESSVVKTMKTVFSEAWQKTPQPVGLGEGVHQGRAEHQPEPEQHLWRRCNGQGVSKSKIIGR